MGPGRFPLHGTRSACEQEQGGARKSAQAFSFYDSGATERGGWRCCTASTATVLPPGIPERAAVPPGWVAAEAIQSRERLAGSIVRMTGGTFQAFDPTTSQLSANSKKLALSATGDLAVVKELNEAAVVALGIESVIYGILTTDSAAGSEAASLSAAGLPAEVRTVPATGGLQEVQLCVGGGAAQTMSINDIM